MSAFTAIRRGSPPRDRTSRRVLVAAVTAAAALVGSSAATAGAATPHHPDPVQPLPLTTTRQATPPQPGNTDPSYNVWRSPRRWAGTTGPTTSATSTKT